VPRIGKWHGHLAHDFRPSRAGRPCHVAEGGMGILPMISDHRGGTPVPLIPCRSSGTASRYGELLQAYTNLRSEAEILTKRPCWRASTRMMTPEGRSGLSTTPVRPRKGPLTTTTSFPLVKRGKTMASRPDAITRLTSSSWVRKRGSSSTGRRRTKRFCW